MKKYLLPFFFLVLAFNSSFSQNETQLERKTTIRTNHLSNSQQPSSVGFSETGANIDVVYHRANWKMNPNEAIKNITGSITTYFKTILPNVAAISFDFNKNAFDNSSLIVKWHGIVCNKSFSPTGNVNVLNIILPTTISATNTLDSLVIEYAGIPENNGLGGGLSFNSYVDQFGTQQNYAITLSESYEDRDWWPCKADMQDKIDSMDINVTVPWNGADTFWVASNGRLIDSSISGGLRTFKYATRYPIASYLVCLAAAKYNRYYSSVMLAETNVPVYWYLLAGKDASYYSNAITAMTKVNLVLQTFSSKLGDYPFKKEKHGFYDGLVGASGMEHQSFSGIASSSLTYNSVLSHELMHQWFGDNVSFATWNDLWLAEGFATYGELLAAEFVPATGINLPIKRINLKNSALSLSAASAWIPNENIINSSTIWDSDYGNTVYDRGGMVVSMLRAMCGDEKFFQTLKNYQASMSGKAANTDTLKLFFNRMLGTDISSFFADYVGGSGGAINPTGGIGNPVYEVKWNSPASNKLLLGVQSQSKTTGSNVSYFHGPVAVRAKGNFPATQDTTIIFYDWGNGNLSYAGDGLSTPFSGNVLSYYLSFTPVTFLYDDSSRVLSTGTLVQDVSLKGYVWNGAINTDWFIAGNWESCCGVPPAGVDVTIATTLFPPILPASVIVKNLTINDGKFISIANNKLTINGTISGSGSIKGSSNSILEITGKAGLVNFSQGSSGEAKLQSLIMKPGSSMLLATNAEAASLSISPSANLTIATGVNLTTH